MRWRALLISVSALAFVAILTLSPLPPPPPQVSRASFTCLLGCHNESLRDLVSNILLFIPLGWSLCYWVSPRRAVLLCLVSTVTIEALQIDLISGRDSSLRDILTNVAGGAIGVWLFANWRTLVWPAAARGAWLRWGAIGCWIGVLVLSGIGIQPAPSARPWYGQWAPSLGQYARYPGQLLAVDLEGWRPPDGRLVEPDPLKAAMLRGSLRLRVEAVSGPQPPRAAPIFSVYDDQQEEQLFVGQDRRSLLLHLRNHFEAWELRGLTVRLPVFPGLPAGDTLKVEAGVDQRQLRLRANAGQIQVETSIPQTVGLGWSSLLPVNYPVWDEWILLNPIWLAALIIPVGYWSGRLASVSAAGVTLGALLLGLGVIPHLSGAAVSSAQEWVGATVGASLGWLAGAWSLRRAGSATTAGQ